MKRWTTKISFLILLLLQCLAPGATYYIAQGGNDVSPGTLSRPWKTIAKANQVLQPGDTVYIRAGTYEEQIRPARSGAGGDYITYASYSNDKVVIANVAFGADLRNRSYIVIDGLIFRNNKHWINMRGEDRNHKATHNIIRDCHMQEARGWAGIYMKLGTDHNKILNNTLIGYRGPDDLIYCRGGAHYNLIEGNDFSYGPHQCLDFQGTEGETSHNIIRNNRFRNPWHTSLAVYPNADWSLVEGNIIFDSGENYRDNRYGSERDKNMARRNHGGIQLGSSHCIIRNNVLIYNGCMSMNTYGWKKCLDNRIYNNTFFQNYRGLFTNTPDPVYGNLIKNNIFFNNRECEIYRWINNPLSRNYYVNNNIGGSLLTHYPDKDVSLAYLQTKYPDYWYSNLELDPMFVDQANRDVHLRQTSPMIDAGAFLTKTVDAGSGTTIKVEDASYFCDGWGIIEGDLIQLEGQTARRKITSVDYDSNILTIETPLTWKRGRGVSLAYEGKAPDIGAYEYDAQVTQMPAPMKVDPPKGR